MTHIFFYATKTFARISNWDGNECTIQTITHAYRAKLETIRDSDIDRIMKSFKVDMKQRYRIPPVLVEKYKDELCFMEEIDFTCMLAIIQ